VFNQLGDVERCALRPGNVHSVRGWRAVLEPVIARYRDQVSRRYFHGDAARLTRVANRFGPPIQEQKVKTDETLIIA
jgi:hypothetical protein